MTLCTVLAFSLLSQGPRIRRAEYDVSNLTRQPGESIILKANQPLASVSMKDVRVTPHVDMQVTTSGSNIIIQPKQKLRHDVSYTLTVARITAKSGRQSSYTLKLQTPPAAFYYMQRTGEPDNDQILSGDLSGTQRRVIYQANKIIEFALLKDNLIVSSRDKENRPVLTLYNMKTKKASIVALPKHAFTTGIAVSQLKTSHDRTQYGFVLAALNNSASRELDAGLFIGTIDGSSPKRVQGIGNKPIAVSQWEFSADNSSIAVATLGSGALFVDPSGRNKPLPIGNYYEIGDTSADGSVLLLGDYRLGTVAYDVRNRTETSLKIGSETPEDPYVTKTRLLRNGQGYVRQTYTRSAAGQSTAIVIQKPDITNLYQPAVFTTFIENFTLSSNDQYIAVEQYDNNGSTKFDDYTLLPKPRSLETVILDVATKNPLTTVSGSSLIWY